MGQFFTVETDADGICTATLDYPGKKVNKLSTGVWAELSAAIDTWEASPNIRAVVLASAKPGIFLAGADIDELQAITSADQATLKSEQAQAIYNRLELSAKPVVAAINGAALGGGMELVLACRAAVAADDERVILGLPETKLGLIPAAGGTQRLPRFIGVTRAVEMIVSGDSLSPIEALDRGLVQKLTSQALLLPTARLLALELLSKDSPIRPWAAPESPQPLREPAFEILTKVTSRLTPADDLRMAAWRAACETVVYGAMQSFHEGLKREREFFGRLAVGTEARELIRRFLEKRKV